jgi:uncharacterized damage-inducible protein DinB
MTPNYDPQFIRHLFDYMIFADREGFDACAALPEEEYFKDRGFSFGSIHSLLCHQMGAQKGWLARWHGNPPTRLDDKTDHPTREALNKEWAKVHFELIEFVSKQTEASLDTPLETRRLDGEVIKSKLGAQMMHVADHGTYHRGQLASMLKQAGAKPVYSPYFRYAIQAEKK